MDRNKRDGAGEIRLLTIPTGYGGLKSVDVEFALPNGKVAGRIQIKNMDNRANSDDNDAFTETVLHNITEAITKKYPNSAPKGFFSRLLYPTTSETKDTSH